MSTPIDPVTWLPLPVGLAPGYMVGPWRIEHELGSGGMGVVYAAVHELIGKKVAIKILQKRASSPGGERFLTEARAVNAIGHPNIVDIFEVGELDDGRPYFVMERLQGKTLGERAAAGELSPIEAIDYLLPLCDALAAAHKAGVVHRDIKLDNVFLVDTAHGPFVKLLDWGIASVANPDGTHDRSELVGTPRYLAPEQACGDAATRASDVYSLGVLSYELFLEAPPFSAQTPVALLLKHVNETPPPPRERWPDIPKSLEKLLLDMLEKSPTDRPSVTQVANRLREIRAELAGVPMHVTAPQSARVLVPTIGHQQTMPAAYVTGPVPRPSRRAWVGAFALVLAMVGARLFLDEETASALSTSVPTAQATTAAAAAPSPAGRPVIAAAGVHDAELDRVELTGDSPDPVQVDETAIELTPAAHTVRSPRPTAARAVAPHASKPRSSAAPQTAPTRRRLHRDAVIEPY